MATDYQMNWSQQDFITFINKLEKKGWLLVHFYARLHTLYYTLVKPNRKIQIAYNTNIETQWITLYSRRP